ncbi:MAG: hypothetical protein LBJ71_03455 [Holosporaceae bacterium]|jgi:hypothetical protein|nr:hypothetical protein [Holosporaceae bacterium]
MNGLYKKLNFRNKKLVGGLKNTLTLFKPFPLHNYEELIIGVKNVIEKKIIVEVRYYIWLGSTLNPLEPRDLFGSQVLMPGYIEVKSDGKIFFPTVVIFAPKPGLFDENTPPR